jgi:hypothetical protein
MRSRLETAAAIALLSAHFFSLPWTSHAIVTDVRHYLYFAQRVADGQVPYCDFFDIKTPLATAVGAVLLRAGAAFGADGLLVLRAGFLAVATAVSVLAFLLHRRLGATAGSGWLGVAPLVGFSLLGLLPAVGNVPKLFLAGAALGAALALDRARWRVAGAAAAVAFLDWQVGLLVLLAAAATAIADGRGRRTALIDLGVGFGAVAAPAALVLAAAGALPDAFAQTVGAALFRGEASQGVHSLAEEWTRRLAVVRAGCPGEVWILALAPLGALRLAFCARAGPGVRAARFLLAYHASVLAFSALDFQMYGDLFLLLHSAGFLAGAALWPPRHWRSAPARAAGLLAVGLALLAVRPWQSRRDFTLRAALGDPPVSLMEQRALARRLDALLGSARVAALGPSEFLFLAHRAPAGPLVVWTPATARFYRRSAEEPDQAVLARLLRESQIDRVLLDGHRRLEIPGFRGPTVLVEGGARVEVLTREGGP